MNDEWTPLILKKKKIVQKTNNYKSTNNIKLEDDTSELSFKKLSKEQGQQLLRARNDKKMTQMDLAKKLNISFSFVKNYENGNIIPDKRILKLICDELSIKIKL